MDKSKFPSHVPTYVNKAYQVPQSENLPVGVYEMGGFYHPVYLRGNYWKPALNEKFKTPYEAHQQFQRQYAIALRLVNQYYSLSELYSEVIASGTRQLMEKFEDDLEAGRETKNHGKT